MNIKYVYNMSKIATQVNTLVFIFVIFGAFGLMHHVIAENTETSCPPDGTIVIGTDINGNLVGNNQGTVTNTSENCTYKVGLASYKMTERGLNNQILFDTDIRTIAPKETVTLTVEIPSCAYQIDLFQGEAIPSGFVEYGPRIIFGEWRIDNDNFCQNDTNTVDPEPESNDSEVCISNPINDVTGSLVSTNKGTLTNNSETCSYKVGVASYNVFSTSTSQRTLFDHKVVTIAPKETVTLTVNTPSCIYENYVFTGEVLQAVGAPIDYKGALREKKIFSDGLSLCSSPEVSTLHATCEAIPTVAYTGTAINWIATVSGTASSSTTYLWSGTDNLSGTNKSITKTYTTPGTKNATVLVTYQGKQATANCSTNIVSRTAVDFSLACEAIPNNPQINQNVNWNSIVSDFSSGHSAVFDGVNFQNGLISFADRIISHDPLYGGGPAALAPNFINPERVIGSPDYAPNTTTGGTGSYSLGYGGMLTIGFADNILTNSGNSNFDLWIFETGTIVEDVKIYVRPTATTSTKINSSLINSDGFVYVGSIGGSVKGIDIDATVSGFNAGSLHFSEVRLIDAKSVGGVPTVLSGSAFNYAGADIDAVGAVYTVPNISVNDISYVWSGTDGLSGNTKNVSKAYTTSGTKNATVVASIFDTSKTANCSLNISNGTTSTTTPPVVPPPPPSSVATTPSSVATPTSNISVTENVLTTIQPQVAGVYLAQVPYTGLKENIMYSLIVMIIMFSMAYVYYSYRRYNKRLAFEVVSGEVVLQEDISVDIEDYARTVSASVSADALSLIKEVSNNNLDTAKSIIKTVVDYNNQEWNLITVDLLKRVYRYI